MDSTRQLGRSRQTRQYRIYHNVISHGLCTGCSAGLLPLHLCLLPILTPLVPLLVNNLQTSLRRRYNVERLDTDPLFLIQHEHYTFHNVLCNERLEAVHEGVVLVLVIANTERRSESVNGCTERATMSQGRGGGC